MLNGIISLMKARVIFLSLLTALAIGNANAAAVWGTDASAFLTGSRSSPLGSGVDATQQWDNGGFTIDWIVTANLNGTWTYNYSIDVTNSPSQIKNVSHFILEVTNDAFPFNILGGTSSPIEGPQVYSGTQPSNPLLPNDLYGVKFDFGSSDGTVDYTIVTDRAPVWGVFYAKDGKTGGNDVVAYANALNQADYMANESLAITDFIVRPDGAESPVPIPAAIWLFGSAVLGFFGLVRRSKPSC